MRLTETYHDLSTNWYRKGMVVSSTVEFPKVTQKVTGNLKAYCKTIDASVHSSHRDNPSALSCMCGRSGSALGGDKAVEVIKSSQKPTSLISTVDDVRSTNWLRKPDQSEKTT